MDLDNGCWPFFSSPEFWNFRYVCSTLPLEFSYLDSDDIYWASIHIKFCARCFMFAFHWIFTKTLCKDIVVSIVLMKKQTKKGSVTCPRSVWGGEGTESQGFWIFSLLIQKTWKQLPVASHVHSKSFNVDVRTSKAVENFYKNLFESNWHKTQDL